MPSELKTSDINSQTDPSVARQYDDETPKDQQIKEFFKLCDDKKVCMLSTYRKGTGKYSLQYLIKSGQPDVL